MLDARGGQHMNSFILMFTIIDTSYYLLDEQEQPNVAFTS